MVASSAQRSADRVGHLGDGDVDVLARIPRSPRGKAGADRRDPVEFGHRHTATVTLARIPKHPITPKMPGDQLA
jgi:hypothetical protein